MRILFDHNVPAYLLSSFPDASTTFQEGWHELSNRQLLDAAEANDFSILMTLDQGFHEQQNISGRKVAIAILLPSNQSRAAMTAVAKLFGAARTNLKAGTVSLFRPPPQGSD